VGLAIPWRVVSWVTGVERSGSERLSYALTPLLILVLIPLVRYVPMPAFCIFKHFTAVPCPGCGLTRSLDSLLHGEIELAWQFNPCGYLVLLALASQVVIALLEVQKVVGTSARLQASLLGDAVVRFGLLSVWLIRLAELL